MTNKLNEILIVCNECGRDTAITNQSLTAMLKLFNQLTFSNINTLVSRFVCSNCFSKDFKIFDANGDLLFDKSRAVYCLRCGLPIPFPRISVLPGIRICTLCKEEEEEDSSADTGMYFPAVPRGYRGKCPKCLKEKSTGIVVVYHNSKDNNFFLGCSLFPKCRWTVDVNFK